MGKIVLAEAGNDRTGGTSIDQERRGRLEFLQSDGIGSVVVTLHFKRLTKS